MKKAEYVCYLGMVLLFGSIGPYSYIRTVNALFTRVCEGDFLSIQCTERHAEFVFNTAVYGRTSPAPCNPTGTQVCAANDVKAKMNSLCNGQNPCSFNVGNNHFGDSCPGASKYLELNWQCIVPDPCPGFVCYYESYCHVDNNNEAYCNCSVGMDGLHCDKSATVRLKQQTAAGYYDVNQAILYAINVEDALRDQLRLNYPFYHVSMIDMVQVGENIVNTVRTTAQIYDNLAGLTNEITGILDDVILYLHNNLCTQVNHTVCLTLFEGEDITKRAENALANVVDIMLTIQNSLPLVDIHKQDTSVTVIKTTGHGLVNNYDTDDATISMPYWETFQVQNADKKVSVNMLSYRESPYFYASSASSIDTPVLRVSVNDEQGKEVSLVDESDPFLMAIDASKIYSGAIWRDMEELKSEDGTYMLVGSFKQNVTDMLIEIELASKKTCDIYGKYGYSVPSKDQHDIFLRTKGLNKVMKQYPFELTMKFSNQILTLPISYTSGEIEPLVLTVRCEDHYFRRRKRQLGLTAHQYRTAAIDVLYLQNGAWTTGNETQITTGKSESVNFESSIFGTFSASVFLIPPDMIDFAKIFANFSERLAENPYALIVNISILVIAFLLVIPLRRLDNGDRLLWEYYPLQDNPSNGKYKYHIAVYTGMRSSSNLTSIPYIQLKGFSNETKPRILKDGHRKNFTRGTCSHFVLMTHRCLGKLKNILVWHDNEGSSPKWFLDKIVIHDICNDERYLFICENWLSLDCEDGQLWRRLHDNLSISKEHSVSDLTTHKMFEEHLWFSISKRPTFSRFTRVQRLWTLIALLYLSMVTSAMWYDTGEEVAGRSIALGPFTLNYKQVYVGVMSSVIAIIPSLLIVIFFKKRKLKDENKKSNSRKEKYVDGIDKKLNKTGKNTCYLPWWTIFFSYFLVFACLGTSATFTFLYSLDWESSKTLDWLFSLLFGTLQSVFVIEPVKVILISFIISIVCKPTIEKNGPEIAPPSDDSQDNCTNTEYVKVSAAVRCPNTTEETIEMKTKRLRSQLDRKLGDVYKDFFIRLLYVVLLCILCSHNTVFISYLQNQQLKDSLNISVKTAIPIPIFTNYSPHTASDNVLLYQIVHVSCKLNSTTDVWIWLNTSFIPSVFPTTQYNQYARPPYVQRFMFNEYSYRMGPVQLRQVRIKGSCTVPDQISNSVEICSPKYSTENEEKGRFCRGWLPFDYSCFDENEDIDYSYLYIPESETKVVPFFGIFGIYNGGGYVMDLGPKQSLALTYTTNLTDDNWIDNKTRAVFIDLVSFNANTRLFSHVKVVFEFPPTGGVYASSDIWSSNLYPYVESWDYVVLALQLTFVIIVFIKLVLLCLLVAKLKKKCCTTFEPWIALIDIILSITAISSYIVRIDQTISALEEIMNSYGVFISFELVHVFDFIYVLGISGVLFIAILDLLRPLTFNYYLYLMRTSISIAGSTIVAYIFMLAVPITAFATVLYSLIGHTDEDFKDMQTAVLTMWRMMLSMINLQKGTVLDTAEAQLVFGLFMIVVAIILVNMFVSILNDTFSEVKDQKAENVDKFDTDLNGHFWRKLTGMVVEVGQRFGMDLSYLLKEDKGDASEYEVFENAMTLVIDKMQLFDDLFINQFESREEHETMVSVDACAKLKDVCKDLDKKWDKTPLQCVVGQYQDQLRYTYYDFENRRILQFIASDASQSVLDSLECYDDLLQRKVRNCFDESDNVINERLIEIKAKVEWTENALCEIVVFPISNACPLVSLSYDNRKTWKNHATENKKKTREIHITVTKIPTHIHIKASELDANSVKSFEISPDGGNVFTGADKDDNTDDGKFLVKFLPGCFHEVCTITIKGQMNEQYSVAELFVRECPYKEVMFIIPLHKDCTWQQSDVLLLQRYGQGMWKILDIPVVILDNHLLFSVTKLPYKTPHTIFAKTSEISKIKLHAELKKLPANTIEALETFSQDPRLVRKWRQIALCLGVYSKVMEVKKGEIPMCAEELCFIAFHEWIKLNPCSHIEPLIEILTLSGILLTGE